MVQQTQPLSPAHLLPNNSYSSMQPSSHFAYQSGMINYMQPVASSQHPHLINSFVHSSQYPQNLTNRGNHIKQSNTQSSPQTQKINHNQHNLSSHNHQNVNKLKTENSFNFSNNKQALNNHKAKETFDLTKNEKDWPQLNGAVKKNLKNNNNKTKKVSNRVDEEEDDEDNVSGEEAPTVIDAPKTPYLADANQLKKLIKNVNFIKTTVEQHYLTENNLKQNNFSANNHISVPVSFKDAVLAKPKPTPPPPPPPIKEVQSPIIKKTHEKGPNLSKDTNTVVPSVNSSSKPKRRSRRSRSKKNRSADDTRKSVDRESFSANFDLQNEEFPDLLNSVSFFETKTERVANSLNPFQNQVKLDPNSIGKYIFHIKHPHN
jgi:hypothetical protein